jgi:putative peptidoglycan lipid II flippase
VSTLHGAYRITELMFGGIIVQLTTVLLPVMSRQLRTAPDRASRTLLDTITLTSFVTLPTAAFLMVLGTPVIGVALGGGRLDSAGVTAMGSVLAAYALSVVGLGQAKVLASAFFARRETTIPMWCSLVSLAVFTAGCAAFTARFGTVAIAWSNTIAVGAYGLVLTVVYAVKHGFHGSPKLPILVAVVRQGLGCVALLVVALRLESWMTDVVSTSIAGLGKLVVSAGASGGTYLAVVSLLGGREIWNMALAFRGKIE